MWKLVVNESTGQEAFAFTAGDEKSKTGWEALADGAMVYSLGMCPTSKG